MGLPVEVNNLMMGSLGGYTIGRSLRFRSSSSAYLNRTLGSPSRTTNTISCWVKRGNLTSSYGPLYFATNWNSGVNFEGSGGAVPDSIQIIDASNSAGSTYYVDIRTSQVFRDPSAWYHLVIVYDTTNATSSDRIRLYVNGARVTNFQTATYPSQNQQLNLFAPSEPWRIGSRGWGSVFYLDGYMAEFNYIDGQALTPSSFGAYDTNGVWQPKKYTGTYGTNGFYLPFSNTTSTTTLVQDSSGNGNNWTPNNISLTAGTTYDSMIDSPTVSASSSNYCVVSPLAYRTTTPTPTISNGNLTVVCPSASASSIGSSTFGVSSGKWYWEVTKTGTSYANVGVALAPFSQTVSGIYDFGYASNEYAYVNNGNKYNNNTASAYGATYTNNDIIGVALDLDAGTLTFYKNNASQGTAYSGLPSGTYIVGCYDSYNGSGFEFNFGQRPFTYTPPTGFNALNTYNLPAPSIANGAQYMAATTWTGNGTSQTINNGNNTTIGTNFQPDFIWIKDRSTASAHALTNSIVGTTKYLESNSTNAETTDTTSVTAINSNGFSLGAGTSTYYTNRNGDSFVGWQWKANGGTGVTNTSGTITSTVSANPTAGFSVVTYSGNGTNGATVGHGLGVTPAFVIMKSRSLTGSSPSSSWICWHQSISQAIQTSSTIQLNTFTGAIYLNLTSASSTYGMDAQINASGQTYVAYCFAAVSGYSAFSSYVGNASSDGPFCYTGFRPRFLLIKSSTTAHAWEMFDTSRDTYNAAYQELDANSSNAEYTAAGGQLDILSNGFKVRYGSSGFLNASGQTYIWAAFCENPFKYSRAR
jgi:hypothetical protein